MRSKFQQWNSTLCDFVLKSVYKFVRCNPNGDLANCVVQQTPKMPWSPELPSKLPASTVMVCYFCQKGNIYFFSIVDF
uniref:Uncharacterized protein n=1 Tax=Oryzias sinensis TaxID=183150 RepID=A0A8C8DU03_9TELE